MKYVARVVAASFCAAAAVLLLSWTNYFDQLNFIAYDFTLRLAGPIQPASPILIVAIDEDSLGRIGSWPWSREKLAQIIERIEKDRPRAIGVDVLLDERTAEGPDSALAVAVSKSRSIVLATRIDSVDGRDHWRRPNAQFIQAQTRLGHVHADPDLDGISRRVFSAKIMDGLAIPAFAIEVLHGAGVSIPGSFEQKIAGGEILRPQPVNIRFVGDRRSFRHIPAWEVLDGRFEDGFFEGKIVLVGSTAEGLGDQWFTPFSESGQRMSGVEIHANAIETLFAGRSISDVSDLTMLAALSVFMLGLWWTDRRFEGKRFYLAAILSLPGIVVVSWVLMRYANEWFPFPPFLAAVLLAVPGLEVGKVIRVNRDLDQKIERLSGWLEAFGMYEKEPASRADRRRLLFEEPHRNARWKLDAVDFFNEELVRFVTFNDAILSSIQDVIIVSDPAERVAYQNPAAKRLDGFQENPPFAPSYFAGLLDGRSLGEAFESALAGGKPLMMEFVPSRNGKKFYHVTLSPISRFGVVMGLHDTTAQHELNQAKNEMVSLVSHELRTPLTSIRGYSDMLMKYDLVHEKGKPFLETILDETKRLNLLIQSFLDIAYIESGRQKITLSEFEIAPVLRDIVGIVGPAAADKQIEIVTNGPDIPVRADRLLLYQALSNLVTNAIKYSPSRTVVKIDVENGAGRVRFAVSDQGYGIPAEETSRIFEKFYRRANKETDEQSGFGLGLAFVKEVAIRHGGDVIVESEVGKGSVFTLWMPS